MISTIAVVLYILNVTYILIYGVLAFFKKKVRFKMVQNEITWGALIAPLIWNTILIPALLLSNAWDSIFLVPIVFHFLPLVAILCTLLQKIHDNLEES